METTTPGGRKWIVFLVLVLALGAGLYYWRAEGGQTSVEFESEKVKRGSLTALVSATGKLESTTTVTVGSQVSGPVDEVLVDFNSEVVEGQVLARLDPSEFQARLAQAQAGLELALAGLENARANLANAQAAIAQAEAQILTAEATVSQERSQVESVQASVRNASANVTRARAEKENALLQFQRFEKLYEGELVAASELDQARTTYRVQAAAYETALAGKDEAVAAHRRALARLKAVESDLAASRTGRQAAQAQRRAAQAQVSSARAQVSQAQATKDQAAVDLERTSLRTPIDGIVIERKIEPGQTVAAAFQAPELFVIAGDLKKMQVQADVSEADIGRVRNAQKVSFRVDAYPDREFEGQVVQVRAAPVANDEKTTSATNVVIYGVLVSAPNPELLLKPGMTATVTIRAEQVEGALLVPNAALRFIPPDPPDPKKESEAKKQDRRREVQGRKGTVWVEGSDGPERRDLILGITDEEFTVVREGEVKEGESVLVGVQEEEEKKGRRGFRMRM